MNLKVIKKINTTILEFSIEGTDEKEALSKSLFLTEPDICGNCKGTNINWRCQKAKGFTFIKRACRDCKYESQLGTFKDEDGYFWKAWNEPYNNGNDNIESQISNNEPSKNTGAKVDEIFF